MPVSPNQQHSCYSMIDRSSGWANRRRWREPSLGAGWTQAVANGGAGWTNEGVLVLSTSANANGQSRYYTTAPGYGVSLYVFYVDFSKPWEIMFVVERGGSDATCRARVQFKAASALGQLAELGIGIEIQNLTIWGAGFNTGRGEVTTGVTMTMSITYEVWIVHNPSVPQIDYYVEGAAPVSITNTNNIPQAVTTAWTYMVVSIEKVAGGATDCEFNLSNLHIFCDK